MFEAGMVSGKANCSQVFSDPENCFESRVTYNYGNYLDFFKSDNPVTCQAQFCSPHFSELKLKEFFSFDTFCPVSP